VSEIIEFPPTAAAKQLLDLTREAARTKLEDKLAAQLRFAGMPHFVREYPYAQIIGRKYRADFAFVPDRLLIQVEGGIYTNGKHTRGAGFESDCERDAIAVTLGWCVLRVCDKHIRTGIALKWVESCLLGGP
jgi:very-short-patch-repair endonuclease